MIKKIGERSVNREICCDNQNMIKDNGGNICSGCGMLYEYDYAIEYVDLQANKFRINKRSIDHRKYRLYNTIDLLSNKRNIRFRVMMEKSHSQ